MKNLFDSKHTVLISPWSILFTVAILLGLYFLYTIQQIIVSLFLAVILMAALAPAVRWLQRRLRFPKVAAILFMYVLVITGLIIAFNSIVPPLVAEIPRLVATFNNLPALPEQITLLNFSIPLSQVNTYIGQFFGQVLQNSFGTAYSIVIDTVVAIFSLFTILVMAAYLLVDRENLYKKIGWFSKDKKHFGLAKEFVDGLEVQLGGWVRGQVFLMVSIGVITYIGLLLLGVPYALPLALLAGLLEILPNLGPTVSAIPGIVLAFGMNTTSGVFVLLFYIIVQQLENTLIVPKIMKDAVDVNPLTTILSILIGFKLAGVLGALLAVPVYIVLRSAYSLWWNELRSPSEAEEKKSEPQSAK